LCFSSNEDKDRSLAFCLEFDEAVLSVTIYIHKSNWAYFAFQAFYLKTKLKQSSNFFSCLLAFACLILSLYLFMLMSYQNFPDDSSSKNASPSESGTHDSFQIQNGM